MAHNSAAHLPACLESIAALDYPDVARETIVVDNASTDGTTDLLRRAYPDVRLLAQPTNLGFAEANNLAARATSAECLAFLNADMRVDRRWLTELVRLFAPDERCQVVGSMIFDWTGERIDFAGGVVNFHGHGNHVGLGLRRERVRVRDGQELPFACGGAMLVGRAAFLDAGGFDARYFIYFEDVDLGWRLRLLGHRVRLAAQAFAFHHGHATTAAFPRAEVALLYERNALRTLVKNLDEQNLARLLPPALLLLVERARLAHVAASAAQRNGEATTDDAVARLRAVGDVVRDADALFAERARIQSRRRVPDHAVFATFGRPLQPAGRDDDAYLTSFARVVEAFGIADAFPAERPRLLAVHGDTPSDRTRALTRCLGEVADVEIVGGVDEAARACERDIPPDVVLLPCSAAQSDRRTGQLPALVAVDVADTAAPPTALPAGDAFLCASRAVRERWIAALAPPGSLPPYASPLTSPLADAVFVVPTPGVEETCPAALRTLVAEPWSRERLEARRRAAEALAAKAADEASRTPRPARRRVVRRVSRAGAPRAAARSLARRLHDRRAARFTCNVCGSENPVSPATFEREQPSCLHCGSTARWRSVVHVLSVELFRKSIPLPDFPRNTALRGVGLSDWEGYATRLAERLDYRNTFFHDEPRLDLTDLADDVAGAFDFVICSEVLEHVAPPVERAFRNLRRLLRPGGVAIVTTPYGLMEQTVEHFPDLHRYELVELAGGRALRNVTRAGEVQLYRDLVFHGGEGSTLEMRVFAERDLIHGLHEAGFGEVVVYRGSYARFGVGWDEPWSLPVAARVPAGAETA